ncbi:DinB superfamily protein [Chitinophaga sp. YR573]|uniref:DinB family protein n=1 Tax=Chitinophaga sp. YR573 TaxID=1881040 RepID=UPI0008D1409D|nr:DinB family protein [Chitinophaga sp. YR573]SEW24786.1 DinB superfamily protein [Chitinophaga sp. YR573]
MKPIDKDKLLDTLENMVNYHIQTAVQEFQNMQDEPLLKLSATGGWSIAQCLEHLNRYGVYYIPLIREALTGQQKKIAGGTFTSGMIGGYFTRLMDPVTGKKKLRAFRAYTPDRQLDAHTVVAEFIRQQEALLSCLQRARQADLNHSRIPVSILKLLKLKVGDALQFVIFHDERHIRQARMNCPEIAAAG